jgi:outer membrane receptor protein involved in Fe transport
MVKLARVGLLTGLIALCSWGSQAHAQAGATTAAIDGSVTDSSGGALPGVTITVASPSLQGQRTAVTSPEGVYRLQQLPPGEYRISYEMPGFATIVREKQALAVGFNATINVQMQVSAMQETLTVTGESPVVDQKASKIVTTYDAEKLASLPSSRDIWSIMAVSPAVQLQRVDVGGSTAGTQTGYSSYDTKADQHRPMIEGIVMTEGTGAAGFYYDYGSFSEVSVGSGSHSADMGWPGIVSSFISKSGGNQYHGRLYADYQNGDIQSSNIDDTQAAYLKSTLPSGSTLDPTDLNRMSAYRDLNGDAGGYLKKDKLWWYGSIRNQQIDVRYANFPVKPFVTKLNNYTGKGTYTLNANNKLIGYGQWGRKAQPNRLDYYTTSSSAALHSSEESTWNQSLLGRVWKGEWNGVLKGAYVEARGGEFGYTWTNHRYGSDPAFQDLGNNQVRGSNRNWGQNISRRQGSGSASFFKDNMAGSHNFKLGGEVFRETIEALRGLDGADTFPGDILQVLRNGAPIEVYQFAPTESVNGLWTYGAYASDNWQITNRLTANIGVRYDRYRGFVPAQGMAASTYFAAASIDAIDNAFTFNNFSPRIGVNYDLFGNGKTLLKFNYGQYWWNPGTTLASYVNTNPPDVYRRYAWTDTNGNGVWNNGEQGALLASAGGVGSASIDPNLKNTFTREVAAWVDRELLPNFGVRSGVVYRKIDQQYQQFNTNRPYSAFTVPVTIVDPGPDGSVATAADNGASYPGYNLDPAYLALPTVQQVANGTGASEFWTWELTATKRMSNKWALLATFSRRWNNDFSTGYFGNTTRANSLLANPNELINTDDGRYNFATSAFKLTGSYEAPWGLRVSPSYRFQSGQPFGRTFLATMNYGSQRLLAEPIDSQSQEKISVIDTRIEKSVNIGSRRLGLVLDFYNIANSNTEQNINWSSGSTYLAPSTIIGPRIVRFGARFDW